MSDTQQNLPATRHACSSASVVMYFEAERVARRALVDAPLLGFALSDIHPQGDVVADLGDPALGTAILSGALAASVKALGARHPTGAAVMPELGDIPLPHAPGVTARHRNLAHALVTTSVRESLTTYDQGELILERVTTGDGFASFIERSSIALCIVAVAAAALLHN